MVTRKPEPGWHATPNLAAGSFGYVNPSLTIGRGGERLSALAGYSYRTSDAFEDGDGRRFTEITNYRPQDQARPGLLDRHRLGAGRVDARDGPPARSRLHPPGRRRHPLPLPADGRAVGRHGPREPALRGDRPRRTARERARAGLLHAGRPLDDGRAAHVLARQAPRLLDGHAGGDAHRGRQGRGGPRRPEPGPRGLRAVLGRDERDGGLGLRTAGHDPRRRGPRGGRVRRVRAPARPRDGALGRRPHRRRAKRGGSHEGRHGSLRGLPGDARRSRPRTRSPPRRCA